MSQGSMMIAFLLVGVMFSPIGPALLSGQQTSPQVPAEYAQLYSTLQDTLNNYSNFLSTTETLTAYPVTFGAELLPANSNRGTALLAPTAMQGVSLYLNRLQELGIQGVTIAIGYPLYTPNFPNYQDYVQFYKQVAHEIRQRGMKLDVESSVLFTGTEFSSISFSYANITFAQFEAQRKQMIGAIVQDLQPDYLDIGAEPDTEFRLSGFQQFNSPDQYIAYVNYVLAGLNRGDTKVGAGIGTWGNMQYVQNYAVNPNLDFIAMHVYPIVGQASLERIFSIANVAKQHGKRAILDEAWLYKVGTLQATSIAANADIFRLDAFSFWAPLDQQFLASIVKSAQLANVEYISPFWSTYFFAYVDYNTTTSQLSYHQLIQIANKQFVANILADQFSSTGKVYAQLAIGSSPVIVPQTTSFSTTTFSTEEARKTPIFPVEAVLAGLIVGFVILFVYHRRDRKPYRQNVSNG